MDELAQLQQPDGMALEQLAQQKQRELEQVVQESQERDVRRRVSCLYRSWCVRAPKKVDSYEWRLSMALMIAGRQPESESS